MFFVEVSCQATQEVQTSSCFLPRSTLVAAFATIIDFFRWKILLTRSHHAGALCLLRRRTSSFKVLDASWHKRVVLPQEGIHIAKWVPAASRHKEFASWIGLVNRCAEGGG